MTSFIFSLIIMYLAWWMLFSEFRKFLYSEWTKTPVSTWEHLRGVVPYVLRQLSQQNNQAQGFVDGELKLMSQRRRYMLLSFHRMGVIFPGIILLATLQIQVFISLIVIGTILLAVFFKKPGKWIQIAFLAGVFFMTYQWCFYQANQWIFASEPSSLVYFLADGRLFSVLSFLAAGIFITLLTRYEFWSLWISSVLFFAGGLAYLNVFGLILGECIGWALYWFLLSRPSSKESQTIQKEMFLLTLISVVLFLFCLFGAKAWGHLDIRILGPVTARKISFILGWAFWEIMLTFVLMVWGHLRSKNPPGEATDMESIQIPLGALGVGLLKYRSWLPEQIHYRKLEMERRLDSLQAAHDQMSQMGEDQLGAIPLSLRQKSRTEVESLQRLLGALSKNSV